MEREYLDLNKKKIKEEDRRHLLNRYLNETIISHQGSMHNTAITISLLAILISTFTLVYQTKLLWVILPYLIISLFGLSLYLIKLKRVQKSLKIEREKMRINYDELFKHHFAYVINSKGVKD
ncbi:MAG: hypothetical protein KBA47_00535 [Caldisericia bacterium]|nr:hypothetical protein [Caldisericia bacterium]